MRVTLNLDDDLIRQLKAQAAREGRTLTVIIEEVLRTAVAQRDRHPGQSEPLRVSPFAGDGVIPGVDLDDSAALLDVMDSADAAPEGRF